MRPNMVELLDCAAAVPCRALLETVSLHARAVAAYDGKVGVLKPANTDCTAR
jgi:hypothetical protein